MGNKFREKKVGDDVKVVEEGLEAPREEAAAENEATVTAAKLPKQRSDGRSAKAARGIGRVLGGDLLADKLVLRQIPLLLLCLFYLLLIIGNRYRIENMSREKVAIEERINYLREQRIQMQKQYQQNVKMSQIADDLRETGVGITAGPPYELSEK